jgi:hypothetical protein
VRLPLLSPLLAALRHPPPPWLEGRLSPLLTSLPGARQRRRALLVAALAGLVLLLRPWPPCLWLPGWVVGALLLWAAAELLRWLWWPRRWS